MPLDWGKRMNSRTRFNLKFFLTGLYFLYSCLYNRRQHVSVVSIKSDDMVITLGVPQGSAIDPLLFLLQINDFSN